MIRKTLSIIGILLLSGVLINGITMTQHIKQIHAGLEDNLESIQKLNHIQTAIIDKNEELDRMLVTVDKLDQGLDATVNKTDRTLELLSTVVDYNAATLHLNDQMLQYSGDSKEKITAINKALSELSPYMKQLDKMLNQLEAASAKDQQHLQDILQSTKNMNEKIPGVSGP